MLVLSAGMSPIEGKGMTVGNNYGIGETRKTELIGACNTLGITRKDRCVVLDHKYPILVRDSANGRDLQDNPHVWWDTDLVAKIVQEYVKKWNVDSIITFDEGGVSGHINHRAVGAGVRYPLLLSPNLFPRRSSPQLLRFYLSWE